jgi:cytochrome c oxidase subunit 2
MDFSNGDTLVLHTPASEHGLEVDRLMNIVGSYIYCSGAITKRFYIISFFLSIVSIDRKAFLAYDNNKLEAIWSVFQQLCWQD